MALPNQAGNSDITYGAVDLSYGLVEIFSVNETTVQKKTYKGNGDVAGKNWSGLEYIVTGRFTHLTDAATQINTEVGTAVGLTLTAQHPLLTGLKVFIDEITDEFTGGENPEERTIDFIGSAYPDAAFNV